MQYPDILAPVGTEPFVLASGEEVQVAKAAPEFALWTGPPPADPYLGNGKPVVGFEGEPLFAELAILRALQADGWDGVWVDTFRTQFLTGMGRRGEVAEAPLALLNRIYEQAGARSGCFDIFAWKSDSVLFAEAKWAQRDQIRSTQVRWLSAALDVGVPLDSFMVVEWSELGEGTQTGEAIAGAHLANSQQEAEIETFDDSQGPEAHENFVAWVTAYPDAFVLNPSSSRGPMIHLAKCPHIAWADYKDSRMTTSEKLGCIDRQTLERHWRSQAGSRLVTCRSCM